jgi:hypothetical protein
LICWIGVSLGGFSFQVKKASGPCLITTRVMEIRR